MLPKKLEDFIGRKIGVQPVVLAGRWGTTVPNKVAMTVVVGTPIVVPHVPDPDPQLVQSFLDKFIDQMRDIFESNKAQAGYPDLELDIL